MIPTDADTAQAIAHDEARASAIRAWRELGESLYALRAALVQAATEAERIAERLGTLSLAEYVDELVNHGGKEGGR